MVLKSALVFLLLVLCCYDTEAKLKGDECEVCIGFLSKFNRRLTENGVDTSKVDRIEIELIKACNEAKGKEDRFCYYIGASNIAATKLVKEVTKPLSFSKPVEKICEDLKKKDGQICELIYEKQIDLNTVDLKKLRVRDLKKILNDWGESCHGCMEKSEYISMINNVKVKHIEL